MFFKDVITELTESFMTKKQRTCPNCGKGILKKNSAMEHYATVVMSKFASCLIGGSVPAPDYYFKCPNCKSHYLLVDGKFVPIAKKSG